MHADFPIAWNAERLTEQSYAAQYPWLSGTNQSEDHRVIRVYSTGTFPNVKQCRTFGSAGRIFICRGAKESHLEMVGLKTHVQWKVRDKGGNVLINVWASGLSHSANYQIYPYLYLKQLSSHERCRTAELPELLFTLTAINLFRICVVGRGVTITITANYLGMLWLKGRRKCTHTPKWVYYRTHSHLESGNTQALFQKMSEGKTPYHTVPHT